MELKIIFVFSILSVAKCSDRPLRNCPSLKSTPSRSFTAELKVDSPFEISDSRPKIFCPKDEFFVGYGLLHQENQGMQGTGDVFKAIFTFGITAADQGLDHKYDDHGVLNVIPYCAKPDWKEEKNTSTIYFTECMDSIFTSGHSLYGVRKTDIEFCKAGKVITGFDYHMQTHQKTWDDAGITHVRFRCEDMKVLEASLGPDGYDPEGSREEKKAFQNCPSGSGICGIEPRVELGHHDDNVGLGGMRLFCCAFSDVESDEAETCTFEDVWRNVFVYYNCQGATASVDFMFTAGFSSSKEGRSLTKTDKVSSSGQTIGVESETEAEVPLTVTQTLKLRFEQTFSSSTAIGKEFQDTLTEVQTGENSFKQTIQVGPKKKLIVSQKVIKCGSYNIKTIVMKKFEEDITEC